MGSLFDDWLDGESRKWAAHRHLEAQRQRPARDARRAMPRRLLDHGTATAENLRAAVPVPPGVNPKAFGAVPGPLALARIIRSDGLVRPGRPVVRARPLSRWALLDPAAAAAWLAANPEAPPAGEGDGR